MHDLFSPFEITLKQETLRLLVPGDSISLRWLSLNAPARVLPNNKAMRTHYSAVVT